MKKWNTKGEKEKKLKIKKPKTILFSLKKRKKDISKNQEKRGKNENKGKTR